MSPYKETDDQRARREWRATRPRTEHVYVSFGLYDRDFESIRVNDIRSTDAARATARELELVAAWLDKNPGGGER